MSKRGVIAKEKQQQCDMCGKIAELRPYGPKGECVCFDCGMKDEDSAKRQFRKHVLGEQTALDKEPTT